MVDLMKYEWRKQDKALYGAKKYPALITIPAQNYIMISGKGNPNDVDFSNRVGALYSLAYAVKSSYKAVSLQEEMVNKALGMVRIKKPNPLFEEIHFGTMQNGLCVEILHVGAFDDEPVSFEKMDQFSVAHGLRRSESYHREIYLSNANRVEKSKLKTILRYSVEQIPTGSL